MCNSDKSQTHHPPALTSWVWGVNMCQATLTLTTMPAYTYVCGVRREHMYPRTMCSSVSLPTFVQTGDMRTLTKQFLFPVLPRKDPTNTYSLSSPSSRLSCSAVDFVSSSSCLTSLSLCSSFCCTASNSSMASFNSFLMTFFSEIISSWNEQSCCWRLADNSCIQTDKHKIIRCGLRTFLGDKKCNTDNEVWQIN